MNTDIPQDQLADAREALRVREASTTAQAQMILWDKAMQRAFKGIVPRRTRRARLIAAVEKMADES